MARKNYSKTGEFCRVTFELPQELNADEISLCGEFNDWNPQKNIMIKRKNGRWSTTISLKAGRKYRYKYLLDGKNWENDWDADAYQRNEFGSEDSIIKL
ncbi:isoamylase early set domain-containing protein [Thermodesulfobacteriota bacterium]